MASSSFKKATSSDNQPIPTPSQTRDLTNDSTTTRQTVQEARADENARILEKTYDPNPTVEEKEFKIRSGHLASVLTKKSGPEEIGPEERGNQVRLYE